MISVNMKVRNGLDCSYVISRTIGWSYSPIVGSNGKVIPCLILLIKYSLSRPACKKTNSSVSSVANNLFIYLLEICYQENLAKLLRVSSENKGKNMNK